MRSILTGSSCVQPASGEVAGLWAFFVRGGWQEHGLSVAGKGGIFWLNEVFSSQSVVAVARGCEARGSQR